MECSHLVEASARIVDIAGVGALAAIVAILEALSFTLELEVSGHWPWQRAAVVA